MSKAMSLDNLRVGTWLLLVLVGTVAWQQGLSGKEPQAPCQACKEAKETGIPLLSKVPYISRLFRNSSTFAPPAGVPESIGISFEICEAETKQCPACVNVAKCQNCPGQLLITTVQCEGSEVCEAECCLQAECCASEDCCEAVLACCAADQACCDSGKACCSEKDVAGCQAPCCRDGQVAYWERIIELTATNAALSVQLEAQEDMLEARAEMFEELAELGMQNAKLQAQVELQTERHALSREMIELASENARLQVRVELAEAKLALVHEVARLSLENAELKTQLASQGSTRAAASSAARQPQPTQGPTRLR